MSIFWKNLSSILFSSCPTCLSLYRLLKSYRPNIFDLFYIFAEFSYKLDSICFTLWDFLSRCLWYLFVALDILLTVFFYCWWKYFGIVYSIHLWKTLSNQAPFIIKISKWYLTLHIYLLLIAFYSRNVGQSVMEV